MARHGFGAGVVGRERKLRRAKTIKLCQQVAGGSMQVLLRIMRIDAKHACSVRHQLPKPDCADMRPRAWIKCAFNSDVGAKECEPVARGHPGPAQGRVVRVDRTHIKDHSLDRRAARWDPRRRKAW